MLKYKDFYKHILCENVSTVSIDDLLPSVSDLNVAVHSIRQGYEAQSHGPISVYPHGDKYIVADGHHRLLRAIVNGENEINVKILPIDKKVTGRGTIELDSSDGDYYGLDNRLENGWLIKRL
jgi:hypothetical protein